MIVAYESLESVPTLVASSTSGRVVCWICDGSALTVAAGGVHSEQNMLRAASWPPSLLRAVLTGVSGLNTGGIFGGWSESPRNLASRMCPVALAANTAHTITT